MHGILPATIHELFSYVVAGRPYGHQIGCPMPTSHQTLTHSLYCIYVHRDRIEPLCGATFVASACAFVLSAVLLVHPLILLLFHSELSLYGRLTEMRLPGRQTHHVGPTEIDLRTTRHAFQIYYIASARERTREIMVKLPL